MNTRDRNTNVVDPNDRWLHRVGGISAFVLVAGYLLTFPLYAWVGDPPKDDVAAQLTYFAQHTTGWWAIVFLMVFTDLLLIPIFFGLYMALKHVNKGLMLLAVAFKAFLFVILDLAVTWTAYPALIASGSNYGDAATDAERAALVAAAAYPSAIIESPVGGVYAILIPSLGVLFAGLVMFKSVFGKTVGYIAVATGLTGILFMGSYFVESLYVLRIVNALFATAFYLLAGYRLVSLVRERRPGNVAARPTDTIAQSIDRTKNDAAPARVI